MSPPTQPTEDEMAFSGLRLIRVIILETLTVALMGFLVFGMLWDMGLFRVGLIAGIAIWVLLSPAIEIATVLRLRAASDKTKPLPPTAPPNSDKPSAAQRP